jgi:hypothetical protein
MCCGAGGSNHEAVTNVKCKFGQYQEGGRLRTDHYQTLIGEWPFNKGHAGKQKNDS